MKAAVVYFSYQGTTRRIAEAIAAELDAATVELTPVRRRTPPPDRRTFTWGDGEVSMAERPEIAHREFDFGSVDLLVVGTPVWAGSMAPPVRSFLTAHEFFRRTFALFCCYSGRVSAALDHMEDLLIGNEVIDTLALREPRRGDHDEIVDRAGRWAATLHPDGLSSAGKESAS